MRTCAVGATGRIDPAAPWLALSLAVGLTWAIPFGPQPLAASAHERGKALYERNCAVCHGVDGRADTPVGRLLKPHPRDFADPVEMAHLDFDRLYQSIKDGRPGTAMAAWKDELSETEVGDVIDYIQELSSAAKAAPMSAEALSLESGRRTFVRECATCHGRGGQADTEVAKVLDPPPSQFADPVAMARLDDARVYLAIYRGRPGTAMGGWGELLAPAEIIDVMRYLRTLVRPLPEGTTPAQLDMLVGQQIYRQQCVACHGENGDARTPLGQQLVPRPRDFTNTREMAALSDDQLVHAIRRGVSGTAMAPWEGVLNREDVRRVALYIRRSFGHR